MDRPRPLWLPSLDTVRLLLAPALVFIVAGLDRGYQTELWQHLARGRLVAREGRVVSADHFTFTVPGRPLRDNNWLSQLLYYGLHRVGGLDLIQTVNALALAAAVASVVALCRRESGSTRVAGAAGVCVFLGLWQTLLIRPQSFSVLLFASLHALLLAAVRRPALLALAPPLMALWANVHGGFAVGLLLILAFAGPQAWRECRAGGASHRRVVAWPACFAAAAAATLLNPYGWDVYRYAGELSAVGVARRIEEWLPPTFDTLVGTAFFVSLPAVAALVVAGRHQVTLRDGCVLACFLVPACTSVRMTVWWFLAAAPVAARLAAGIAGERTTGQTDSAARPGLFPAARPSWAAAVAVAGIVAACVGSLPRLERHSPLLGAARSPHRVESDLDALARDLPVPPHADARVFARMEWANFLAWRTDGRAKVFVEGHVELYPPAQWDQYLAVTDARPGWRGVLDAYDVGFLLLDRTYHRALLSALHKSDDWVLRSRAGDALLFERRVASTDAALTDVSGH